jgi:hypothetical protein
MSWDVSAVIGLLLIGLMAGWVFGWAARTDENRRWADSFRRRIDAAELDARQAWAEVERLDTQVAAIPQAAAAPTVINLNLTAAPAMPAVPAYRDLAGATAAALAREIRVIEAGP